MPDTPRPIAPTLSAWRVSSLLTLLRGALQNGEELGSWLTRHPVLHTVLDDWRPTEAGFFLYYPSRRLPSAGLQKFIELVKESRVERTGTTPRASG